FPYTTLFRSVAALLPLARGHQAGGFLEDVQRHAGAEAEAGHVGVQLVDAQLVGQVVEIGVVGTGDGQLQVHPAVAVTVPVAVTVRDVGQLVVARVEHLGLRGDRLGVQAGDHHHRLDGRTRRIQ